jgi:hypothetical protein
MYKFFTSRDVVFHEHIFPYKLSLPIPAPPEPTLASIAPSLVLSFSMPDPHSADFLISHYESPTLVPQIFSPSVPTNFI